MSHPGRFSSRSAFGSEPNRLTRALEGMRQRPLIDLSASNPTEVGLSPPAEAIAALLTDTEGYQPHPFGLPSAREAVAREFGLDAHNVMLTASTSEAYSHLFKLLCDPGDAVLVPSPSYPLFDVLAQLENIALIPYRIDYDGEWHLDADALRAANNGARAIITVHPNNPTGSFLKRDELKALAELGIPIISDEVFADYALLADPNRAVTALEAATETLVFRLGGLSKSCALPQLKLAWTTVAGPGSEEAIERLEHIADAYLSPGTPVQKALPQLLTLGPAIRAPIVQRVRTNLSMLRAAVADTPATLLKVEGGWYAILRVPNTLDDEGWALTLLEQDHLIVQPGYYYELRNGVPLVLSLIVEPAQFAAAMPKLKARLSA